MRVGGVVSPRNSRKADRFLASQYARQEQKLLFLLHVSGDFEDPGFT
jgi:hypothetical protein